MDGKLKKETGKKKRTEQKREVPAMASLENICNDFSILRNGHPRACSNPLNTLQLTTRPHLLEVVLRVTFLCPAVSKLQGVWPRALRYSLPPWFPGVLPTGPSVCSALNPLRRCRLYRRDSPSLKKLVHAHARAHSRAFFLAKCGGRLKILLVLQLLNTGACRHI